MAQPPTPRDLFVDSPHTSSTLSTHLPDINDPVVQKILLRVAKCLRQPNVSAKTATTYLRKKASTLSSELCQSLRWGDSRRQDTLLKRVKRIHRDLLVLSGRSQEATTGANDILLKTTTLAPCSTTKPTTSKAPYAHAKGGQWLQLQQIENKNGKHLDRLARLRQSELKASKTLSPLLNRNRKQPRPRPQSANASRCASIQNKHTRHKRPQSAQSPLRVHRPKLFQSNRNVPVGSNRDFELLSRTSSDVLQQLHTELKHASNDGLHVNGGNHLNDPANGALVQQLSQMYGTLYEGVHGKLNLMLEEDENRYR